MLKKPLVLDGYKGVLQLFGHLVDADPDAVVAAVEPLVFLIFTRFLVLDINCGGKIELQVVQVVVDGVVHKTENVNSKRAHDYAAGDNQN